VPGSPSQGPQDRRVYDTSVAIFLARKTGYGCSQHQIELVSGEGVFELPPKTHRWPLREKDFCRQLRKIGPALELETTDVK
jgi:hypothetical protein